MVVTHTPGKRHIIVTVTDSRIKRHNLLMVTDSQIKRWSRALMKVTKFCDNNDNSGKRHR